jgi:hypothetical protein
MPGLLAVAVPRAVGAIGLVEAVVVEDVGLGAASAGSSDSTIAVAEDVIDGVKARAAILVDSACAAVEEPTSPNTIAVLTLDPQRHRSYEDMIGRPT